MIKEESKMNRIHVVWRCLTGDERQKSRNQTLTKGCGHWNGSSIREKALERGQTWCNNCNRRTRLSHDLVHMYPTPEEAKLEAYERNGKDDKTVSMKSVIDKQLQRVGNEEKKEQWSTAMSTMSTMEIESHGEGWVWKKDLLETFGKLYSSVDSPSLPYDKFNPFSHMFETCMFNNRKYIRLIKLPNTIKVEEDDLTYESVRRLVKQAYTGLRSMEVDAIATIRYDELKKQERIKQERIKQEQERMKQEAVAKAIEEERISNIKRQQEKAELVRKEQEYIARRFSDDRDTLTSKHHLEEWSTAMSVMSTLKIESYGEGWVSKKDLYSAFGKIYNLKSHSAINNRFNVISHIFQTHKMGACKYVKLINKPVSMKSAIDKRLQRVGNEKQEREKQEQERKKQEQERKKQKQEQEQERIKIASLTLDEKSQSQLADMIVKRVFLMLTQHFEPVGEDE